MTKRILYAGLNIFNKIIIFLPIALIITIINLTDTNMADRLMKEWLE